MCTSQATSLSSKSVAAASLCKSEFPALAYVMGIESPLCCDTIRFVSVISQYGSNIELYPYRQLWHLYTHFDSIPEVVHIHDVLVAWPRRCYSVSSHRRQYLIV